jgi:hypothetical protein
MASYKEIIFNELLSLSADDIDRIDSHFHAISDLLPQLHAWLQDRQVELWEEQGEEWDGQPDALQEWHDFDPDC